MRIKRINALSVALLVVYICGCTAPKIIGGIVEKDSLTDGVYQGEAKEGPVYVIAEVTIENQHIKQINLLKHRNWRGEPAEGPIPVRIIEEQSTKVDAVSGATKSSVAIMNAVEDAIRRSEETR